MYGDPGRIAPGTLEGYMQPLLINGTWDYGLNVVACWKSDLTKLASAYSKIKHQTLLMWGDRDPAVFVKSAQDVQNAIAGSRLHVFPSVGHLPYEEVPHDFNAVLLDFMK